LLVPGGEPIPGYQLVEKRGGGGSGQVWEARGPGGFQIAQKFIRLDEPLGAMEQRALDVVKNIRHPRLLSMFASWRMGSWLVIGMELADGTLGDRLRECSRAGLDGIPATEAAGYLSSAAEGIDHLNAAGVQHRDCKPSNLLLLGNSLKVGDFGLSRVLRHASTRHSGGLTPAYSPPEFFEGWMYGRSDQYSLAATYYHLRTGRPPFGGSVERIVMGHLSGTPDLTSLLPEEREAVARAMSKAPKDRWPSCRAFAEAVAQGLSARGIGVVEGKIPDAMMPSPSLPGESARTVTLW
jgi:serine/threonine-protein kinase